MAQNPRASGSDDHRLNDGFQDTLSLLQEEISRLEEEIRLRDMALADSREATALPAPAPEPRHEEHKVSELTDELARRDETIALLFDQIRDLEEAEIASRQEWEQLENWVREVEQRVDSRDQEAEAQKREKEAVEKARVERRALEAERQGWEQQRRELQLEIERLRSRAEASSRQPAAGGATAQGPLEQENRRLRAALEEAMAQAAEEIRPIRAEANAYRAEAETLRDRLADVEYELDRARDEILRQRNEHEAALAALRSELALDTLRRKDGPTASPDLASGAAPAADEPDAPLSTDERMWAFRSHLQDVYKQELEERKNRRLSSRLSRLWSRTGPSR